MLDGISDTNRRSCETHSRGQIQNWLLQVDKLLLKRARFIIFDSPESISSPSISYLLEIRFQYLYSDDTHCKVVLEVAILLKKSLIKSNIGWQHYWCGGVPNRRKY